MSDYFLHLFNLIQQLGVWGYAIIFLIAMLESLVVFGIFIPGTVFMLFAGLLSSQGYMNIGILILITTIGSILGDSLGYNLGIHGNKFFKDENYFLKISYLEWGEKFFQEHGGKSVFLARFVGPLRPIVPFIAGLSKMPQPQFLFWNITSAFLWSVLYLLAGYFFGYIFIGVKAWVTNLIYFSITALFLFFAWRFVSKE
jgi:membrane protein DedA with SNARE-associated domain